MRRKWYPLLTVNIFFALAMTTLLFCGYTLNFYPHLAFESLEESEPTPPKIIVGLPWEIPYWIKRYNVTHLFDWTQHRNGDFDRCRAGIIHLRKTPPQKLDSTTVVNDVLDYFRSHPDEGCIVENAPRLPNLNPHPIPRARSWSNTCATLNINYTWTLCNKPTSEFDSYLPTITRFVTIAVFNGYIDTGYCHPEVPGTIFTTHATFHPQRWTSRKCGNDPIYKIPRTASKYRHTELINSLGTYLSAPGHFAPQQLPRLIRLLAVVPTTAKVLVAKGGIADSLVDVLVERGIVTRDRIVSFDKIKRPYHFGSIVYRSEPWPYMGNRSDSNSLHDRTDMQLMHRVMASEDRQSVTKTDRIILIKREDGDARSIIEHLDMAEYIKSTLKKFNMSSRLHLEIFEARGHVREHIALFRRARVVVGPHGAGMLNIAWSSPRTHVVEIGYTTGMTFPQMYAEMSLHLDQNYWVCKGYGDYDSPIHVDMIDFIYIFNQIMSEIETEHR